MCHVRYCYCLFSMGGHIANSQNLTLVNFLLQSPSYVNPCQAYHIYSTRYVLLCYACVDIIRWSKEGVSTIVIVKYILDTYHYEGRV